MELELKHWAAYLPYDVWVYQPNAERTKSFPLDAESLRMMEAYGFELFKLILRPISELSELIVNEFGYYRMDMQSNQDIIDLFCFEVIESEEELIDLDLTALPYKTTEYIFKKHYDFFGLIDKGLAVDINEINE